MQIFSQLKALLDDVEAMTDNPTRLRINGNRKARRQKKHTVRQKADSLLRKHGLYRSPLKMADFMEAATASSTVAGCLKGMLVKECLRRLSHVGLSQEEALAFCSGRKMPEWLQWIPAEQKGVYRAEEAYGERGEIRVYRAYQKTYDKLCFGFMVLAGKDDSFFLKSTFQLALDELLRQEHAAWPVLYGLTFYDANRNLGRMGVRIYRAVRYSRLRLGSITEGYVVGIGESMVFSEKESPRKALHDVLGSLFTNRETRIERRKALHALSTTLAQVPFTFQDARNAGLCASGIRRWVKVEGFNERDAIYGHELASFTGSYYVRTLTMSMLKKMQAAS